MKQLQQPLQFISQLLLLRCRNDRRPGIAIRCIGVICFLIEILIVERSKAEFSVDGEAVGIGGKALLLYKILQYKASAAGEVQCIPNCTLQLFRPVDPADAFAACTVHRLYNQRIVEFH